MALSGVELTRLGLSSVPRHLYGSFSGKVEAAVTKALGPFTRLSLLANPMPLYGSFAGKVEAEVSPIKKVRRFIQNVNRLGMR